MRFHARNHFIREPFQLIFISGVSLWSKFLPFFFLARGRQSSNFPKFPSSNPVYACLRIYSDIVGADSMPGPSRSWALR